MYRPEYIVTVHSSTVPSSEHAGIL